MSFTFMLKWYSIVCCTWIRSCSKQISGQISFFMILLSLNGKDHHLHSDNSTKTIGMFRPFSFLFLFFTFHLIIFLLIWWVLLAICSKAIWFQFLTGYVFKLFSLFFFKLGNKCLFWKFALFHKGIHFY